MSTESRVRIKDLIGNPKCDNCYGRGWVWNTRPGGKRDARQCGCAKAIRTITRAVPDPVPMIVPPHRAVKMTEGVNLRT